MAPLDCTQENRSGTEGAVGKVAAAVLEEGCALTLALQPFELG